MMSLQPQLTSSPDRASPSAISQMNTETHPDMARINRMRVALGLPEGLDNEEVQRVCAEYESAEARLSGELARVNESIAPIRERIKEALTRCKILDCYDAEFSPEVEKGKFDQYRDAGGEEVLCDVREGVFEIVVSYKEHSAEDLAVRTVNLIRNNAAHLSALNDVSEIEWKALYQGYIEMRSLRDAFSEAIEPSGILSRAEPLWSPVSGVFSGGNPTETVYNCFKDVLPDTNIQTFLLNQTRGDFITNDDLILEMLQAARAFDDKADNLREILDSADPKSKRLLVLDACQHLMYNLSALHPRAQKEAVLIIASYVWERGQNDFSVRGPQGPEFIPPLRFLDTKSDSLENFDPAAFMGAARERITSGMDPFRPRAAGV